MKYCLVKNIVMRNSVNLPSLNICENKIVNGKIISQMQTLVINAEFWALVGSPRMWWSVQHTMLTPLSEIPGTGFVPQGLASLS